MAADETFTVSPDETALLPQNDRFTARHWAAAIFLLLFATGSVFFPLLRNPGGLLVGVQNGGRNDVTSYFATARSMTAVTRDRDAEWPWWNPNLLCGVPVLGNPQSALFYPPNWVFSVWRSPAAVGWMMVIHHLFAGWGTLLLCRKYGFAFVPAVVGAVCFIGAPYYVAHCGEGHYNQICAVAWVPWSFLAYERFRAERRGGLLLVAVTLALSLLCGHAQESFYTGSILSAFTLLDGAALVRQGKLATALRRMGGWCGVVLATLGLAAFEVLPVSIYSRLSVRSAGISMAEASEVTLDLSNLWQMVNPAVLGGNGNGRLYWETLCHFGVVPFLLAMLGAGVAWRRYPTRRMTGLWLIALGFAFGTTLPIFPAFYQLVPGISLFRVPSRALFFCSFAIAVLAAGGTDAVWKFGTSAICSTKAVQLSCLIGGLVAALPAVLKLGGFVADAKAELWVIALSGNLSRWVFALGCLALVFLAIGKPRFRLAVAGGLLLLCVLDMSSYSRAILRVHAPSIVTAQIKLTDELLQNAGYSRVLAAQDHWSDYAAVQNGIQKLQGYEPVPLASYAAAFNALMPNRDPSNSMVGFNRVDVSRYDKRLLDLLGVRYLVASSPQRFESKDWKLLKSATVRSTGEGRNRSGEQVVAIYENPAAMPRAFVVGHATVVAASDERAVESLRKIDPRNEILLEEDVLPDGPRAAFRPADIVEYTANRVCIEVETSRPGYLFLSDVWYPGWSADIDGEPVAVLRANLAFRAVPLPPGRHRVTFRYQPPGLALGSLIALLTAGVLIAGLLPSAFSSSGERRSTSQDVVKDHSAGRHTGERENARDTDRQDRAVGIRSTL